MNNRSVQILKAYKWLCKARQIAFVIIHEKPARSFEVYIEELPIYRQIYGNKLEVANIVER